MSVRGRSILLGLGLSLVASCSGPNVPPPAVKHHFVTCQRPPPSTGCKDDSKPVCAHVDSGDWKTFPSACSACEDAHTIGWRPTACEVR